MLRYRIIRTSTIPVSLKILLKGQLSYLNLFFDVIAVSSPGKDLEDTAIQEGIKTYPVKMERKISPLKDVLSIIQMTYQFVKLKPTIVHSITPKAGLVTMTAAKLAGVPIRIHTFTGLIFPTTIGLRKVILMNVDRIICYCATDIIPEGNGVKKDLIDNKITTKKLKIIGNGNVNGIDTTLFSRSAINDEVLLSTKNMWQIKPNDFVYIFIGRLVKDKGINELIRAFISINNKNYHTKLLLVGDYEQKSDPLYPETINVINNQPNIIHVGFQSDVRPYLAVSNVLVFPSYREGFPNVPMQAGAMGLPSIVTNINGCNEIIQDDINGLIIPPKDASALENAMIELLENNEKRKRLAQNARSLIVARYEQQMLWQLIKQEYDEQLKRANIIF